MTIFRRVLTTARTWRSVPVRRTLNPNPPRALSPDLAIPRLLCHRLPNAAGSFEHQCHSSASETQVPKCVPNPKGSRQSLLLVGLAAGWAAGLTALGAQMSADSAKFYAFVESAKRRELRLRATDRMLARALHGSYLDSKDIDISKPALRFIPSNTFGRIYWQVMLARPDRMKETGGEGGDLRIQVFRSLIPFSDRFEIEFVKDGIWSLKEVDALVSTFTSQLAGGKIEPAERQMNEFAASAD